MLSTRLSFQTIMKLHFSRHILKIIHTSNCMEIRTWEQCCSMQTDRHNGRRDTVTVGRTEGRTDGRTDRQRDRQI